MDYLSIPPGRAAILRGFWDGEKKPSVEAPIGDFFGVGHGRPNYFVSFPLQVNNRGINCYYFPMLFAQLHHVHSGAKDQLVGQGERHDFHRLPDGAAHGLGFLAPSGEEGG